MCIALFHYSLFFNLGVGVAPPPPSRLPSHALLSALRDSSGFCPSDKTRLHRIPPYKSLLLLPPPWEGNTLQPTDSTPVSEEEISLQELFLGRRKNNDGHVRGFVSD